MKNVILFLCLIFASSLSHTQIATVSKDLQNKAVKAERLVPERDQINPDMQVRETPVPKELSPNETIIGTSYFDLQSNSSLSNRIALHPDGSIGAVWTYGIQASAFPDRGTGYNYYNGSSWGAHPTSRIESLRCGWPSYDTWGTAGEINVSHNGTTGLEISKRTSRGTGSWTQTLFQGPAGIQDSPTWPRLVCSGDNHDTIHLVCNSYDPYQGQTAAMLYSRSTDGGATWNPQNIVLAGTGSSYYNEIGADDYTMAARGNTVAILCADAFYDLFVMKSTDNGTTWTKTVIWEHPYPFFDWNVTITDTFFCVDQSASVAIGPDGKVHVAFGINRVLHSDVGTTYSYWPYIDGIGYWNEDIPTFSNDIHALAPPQLGYANSELVTDNTYVGWSQDVNGNGSLDLLDVLSYRQLGLSTMPAICVDDQNNVFIAFSSTTEDYDNSIYNYKHIWLRARESGVWGSFLHATDDITHIFDECVYPVLSQTLSSDDIHMIYQTDYEPGIALDGDHDYVSNNIIHSAIPKTDLISGITYYTISTVSSPFSGGTTTGGGLFASGSSSTIVATPNPNYGFEKWTENDTLVSTNASYNFIVFSDRTFTAHFIQTHGVVATLADPPEGGTTSGDGTFLIGDSVTVSAVSNPDWVFDDWTDSDTLVSLDSVYKFELTGDRTLEANFHPLYCDVTTSSVPVLGGSTLGDSTYTYGDNVTLTAIPNPGWGFESWTENDTVVSTDSLYTFVIYGDMDLVANFEAYTFEVLTSAQPPEGGTTSGGGTFVYGEEVTVIASTNPAWTFGNWSENGTVVSSDTAFTFIVEDDRSLVANYYQDTCIIETVAYPLEGGTTAGDGTYLQGDTVTLTATANTDWEFMNWTKNGNVISTSTNYSFLANHSSLITGNFDFLFSMQELMADQIVVYPLPSSGILNIEFDQTGREEIDEIRLICLSGAHLATYEIGPSNKIRLDLGNIQAGMYLLQYMLEGKVISVSRVVIK